MTWKTDEIRCSNCNEELVKDPEYDENPSEFFGKGSIFEAKYYRVTYLWCEQCGETYIKVFDVKEEDDDN